MLYMRHIYEHVSEIKNRPETPQHCLPHLTHPIQLVRSLVETLRPEVGQKK